MMTSCIVATLLVTAICIARVAANLTFQPTLPGFAEQQATWGAGWAAEAWTGDDRPYVLVRARIDQEMGHGESADSLRIKYGLLAQQRSSDPVAQFAWAYAAVKSLNPETPFRDRYTDLLGVPEALNHVPFPRTYNFARVRFLSERGRIDLQTLGERLLKRDPADMEVKINLVNIYEGILLRHDLIKTVPPGIKDTALAYRVDLIRANPHEPAYIAGPGMVYLSSWERSHDFDDGQRAVAAFRLYLVQAPPGSEFRASAQRFIQMIEGYGKERDKA